MSKVTWDEERALQGELAAAREVEASKERARAYAAVQATLSAYRWWHLSNLLNMFRLWLQGVRQR